MKIIPYNDVKHIEDKYYCPEDGCTKKYAEYKKLNRHVKDFKHNFKLER